MKRIGRPRTRRVKRVTAVYRNGTRTSVTVDSNVSNEAIKQYYRIRQTRTKPYYTMLKSITIKEEIR